MISLNLIRYILADVVLQKFALLSFRLALLM